MMIAVVRLRRKFMQLLSKSCWNYYQIWRPTVIFSFQEYNVYTGCMLLLHVTIVIVVFLLLWRRGSWLQGRDAILWPTNQGLFTAGTIPDTHADQWPFGPCTILDAQYSVHKMFNVHNTCTRCSMCTIQAVLQAHKSIPQYEMDISVPTPNLQGICTIPGLELRIWLKQGKEKNLLARILKKL